MKYLFSLQILLLFLCVSSCGYQFQDKSLSTVVIPYVEGDSDGKFTAELVRMVNNSTNLVYSTSLGELTLKVRLDESLDRNVGFNYKSDSDGELTNSIGANERRKTIFASFSLLETSSNKIIFGPIKIDAFVDYDFETSNTDQRLISLGQLDSLNTAESNASSGLYRALAQKIVENLESRP